MEFKIPESLTIGGVNYTVEQKETINKSEDFGFWDCTGQIEIAETICGKEVSESRKRQTFWHELTHVILHQMGEYDMCDDERFVNTFSSFLSGAVDSMK